jgi:uncharacterized protein YndB with AHSA1/START domain
MEQTMSDVAVRKSVVVGRSVEDAFRVFTDGIDGWWPRRTHSVFAERAEKVVLEGEVGGRFYEVATDDEEAEWGIVTVWEPPHRLAYTWYPGRGPESAQEVDLRFTPEGSGTRVDLVHTGWEKLGDRAAEQLASYETGWEYVLGRCYAEAAS